MDPLRHPCAPPANNYGSHCCRCHGTVSTAFGHTPECMSCRRKSARLFAQRNGHSDGSMAQRSVPDSVPGAWNPYERHGELFRPTQTAQLCFSAARSAELYQNDVPEPFARCCGLVRARFPLLSDTHLASATQGTVENTVGHLSSRIFRRGKLRRVRSGTPDPPKPKNIDLKKSSKSDPTPPSACLRIDPLTSLRRLLYPS